MDADKVMPIIVLIIVIYAWGCLNRGWTSPVDIGVDIACRAGGHRWCGHADAWPEGGRDEEASDAGQMSTPVSTDPLMGPKTVTRPAGPRPMDEIIRTELPFDPNSPDKQPGETRISWTRRQIEAGILDPGEIDDIGSRKFGVNRRTVRRWRAEINGMTIADLEKSEKPAADTGATGERPTQGSSGTRPRRKP